jgi:hypothetical protein
MYAGTFLDSVFATVIAIGAISASVLELARGSPLETLDEHARFAAIAEKRSHNSSLDGAASCERKGRIIRLV